MTRATTRRFLFAALAAAATLSLAPPPASARPDEAADRAAAAKALNAGAALFDAKDAKGLAATYADDGVLKVVTREKDSGDLKVETKRGRAEIEEAYREFLKGDQTYHAKNTIEHVRKIGSDVLLIAGLFTPDDQAAEPMKFAFVQVRKKVGDAWKIMDLQVFILFD